MQVRCSSNGPGTDLILRVLRSDTPMQIPEDFGVFIDASDKHHSGPEPCGKTRNRPDWIHGLLYLNLPRFMVSGTGRKANQNRNLAASNSLSRKKQFRTNSGRTCASEDSREASPQTKVAILAPRDEHRSKTDQIPIRIISSKVFKRSFCTDASATLESFPTHAHQAER